MPLQIEHAPELVDGFSVSIGDETIEVSFAKPTPITEAIRRIRQYLDAIEKPL